MKLVDTILKRTVKKKLYGERDLYYLIINFRQIFQFQKAEKNIETKNLSKVSRRRKNSRITNSKNQFPRTNTSKSREKEIFARNLIWIILWIVIPSNYRRYYFNENFAIYSARLGLFHVSKNKIEEAFERGNCARGFINLVSWEARRSRIIFRNQRG